MFTPEIAIGSAISAMQNASRKRSTHYKISRTKPSIGSVCKEISNKADHIPDTAAKDWQDMHCTDCDRVLRSADLHIHTHNTVKYNRRMHWGTCACGEELPQEGHRFSAETGKCNVCGAISSPIGAQYDNDKILLIGGASFAGIILIMLLILFIRRLSRKRYF